MRRAFSKGLGKVEAGRQARRHSAIGCHPFWIHGHCSLLILIEAINPFTPSSLQAVDPGEMIEEVPRFHACSEPIGVAGFLEHRQQKAL